AFRWTAATGMVDLGQLPLAGVSYIQATGVSADGSMVGGVCQATGGIRSFLWTAAFGMVDLGPAPGGPDFETRGVSADGATIVGDVAGSPGGPRVIRWTFSDGPHDFQNDLTTNYALGSQLVG